MRDLRSWLTRLAALDGAEIRSIKLRVVKNQVTTPSRFDFDDSVIRVADTNTEFPSGDGLPAHLSVLFRPDVPGSSDLVRDMAIAAQLGAVMTMALNRHVRVSSSETTISMEGSNSLTFLPATITDRELAGPIPSNAGSLIEELLGLLLGLNDSDLATIGNALELHYASVLLQSTELNAAYALTVAGIEALANNYATGSTEWNQWDQARRFDSAFESAGLSDQQRSEMRQALLHEKHLGLRQRFARYACNRLPEDWWNLEVQDYSPSIRMQPSGDSTFVGYEPAKVWPITQFVPRDPEILRRRLLASYDARSSYVHVGRRGISSLSTAAAAVGRKSSAKAPIDYVGLRRILYALIELELSERSQPASFPSIKAFHSFPTL